MPSNFSPFNYIGFTNPSESLKLQQQQALAQQLLSNSQKEENPNQMVGNVVAKRSPLQSLSKIGDALAGMYIQNKTNEQLASLYQPKKTNTDDLMANATNAAIGSGEGPASKDAVTSQYLQGLASMLTKKNKVYNEEELQYLQLDPSGKLTTNLYEQRMKKQNALDEAYAKARHDTVTLPGGKVVSKMSFLGLSDKEPSVDLSQYLPESLQPSPGYKPPVTEKMTPDAASKMKDLYSEDSAAPAKVNTDYNNPAAVAGDTEYSKETGKYYGDLSNKLNQAAMDANSKISDYKQLDSLLEGVDTGKFQGNINDVQKIAGRFGIEIPKDVGSVEAAKAIASKLALQAKNEGATNLMPGAMSNFEQKILKEMEPGIENTTSGRKLMIDFATRKLARDQQIADLAAAYEDENGKLDRGFRKKVSKFVESNPLYKEGEFEAIKNAATRAQETVSGRVKNEGSMFKLPIEKPVFLGFE